MSTALVNNTLGCIAVGILLWLVGSFLVTTYRRRKLEEQRRHEWESIQRQIREARTVEEKRVATERFTERLKRVS